MFELDDRAAVGAKIKVVGIGGGGGNAVNTMIASGLCGVEFIVANTDKQSLEKSKASFKIQLGPKTTKGLGAGGNPEVGRAAAIEDEEELRAVLGDADMIFITAGMGGGTGTGAAPIIAKVARDIGALTVGVVTKPFLFEGKKRQKQAEVGLEELRKYVDTLITIPNERIRSIIGRETSFVDAFKKVDEVLLHAVRGISDLINKSGYINLDFADIKSVMKNNRGVALVGLGSGIGEDKARKAANAAMTSPLLGNIRIEGATGLILNITIGPNMSMDDVMKGAAYVTEAAGENADVKFGVVTDEEMGDEMRMTVVATGFSSLIDDGLTTTTTTVETSAISVASSPSISSGLSTKASTIIKENMDVITVREELAPSPFIDLDDNDTPAPVVVQHTAAKVETTKVDDSKAADDLFDAAAARRDTGVRRDKKPNYTDEDYLDIPPYLRNQNRAG